MKVMRTGHEVSRFGLMLALMLLSGTALADAPASAPDAGAPTAAPAPAERKVWRAPEYAEPSQYPDVKSWLKAIAEEDGWEVTPKTLAHAWQVVRQVQHPTLGTFIVGRQYDAGSTKWPGNANWKLVRRSKKGVQVTTTLLDEMMPNKHYEGTMSLKALAFKSKLGAKGQVLWVELEESKKEWVDAHATEERRTRTRLGYAFAVEGERLVQVADKVPLRVVSSLDGKTDVDATLSVQFPAPGVMRVTRVSGEPTPEQQEWLGEYDLVAGAAPAPAP
jgi:hypothetical protein